MVHPRVIRGRVQGFVALLILIAAPHVVRAQAMPPAFEVSDLLPIVVADNITSNVALPNAVAPLLEKASRRSRIGRWHARLTAWGKDARVMLPLYSGFAGLEALDVQSTTRALHRGATEANPLLAGIGSHPVALTFVKAGTAAATVCVMENVRKKNRVAAIATMFGINSAYAMIVVHNYRAVH